MKKLLMLFALVAFVGIGTAQGQGFSEAKSSKTKTAPVTMTIDGLQVQGGTTSTGNVWVLRVSAKSGKEYKQYLGKDTGKTFSLDGRNVPVFEKSHKDGTKSYYAVYKKNGKLSTKKLIKD